MARKSAERVLLDWLMSTVGIALIAIALIITLFREYPLQMIALVLAVAGGRYYLQDRRCKADAADLARAVQKTDEQIERHKAALVSYYLQSVRPDDFDNEDTRLWRKWIERFLTTQVLPELGKSGIRFENDTCLASHVDRRVREIADRERLSGSADFNCQKLSDKHYERECAAILFRSGWTVRPTPVTGDHGADVIAERGKTRLIVQCKLYSKPVPNKAVQEAYSACRLYNGTHACVVAPNGFTAQAQRAAHGLGVRLLHHTGLESFADEISGSVAADRAFG